MIQLQPDQRDALVLYGIFSILCAILLALPLPMGIGIKLMLLVLAFHGGLAVTILVRGHTHWRRLWLFTLFLSVFQVYPDWILSDLLNVLFFPEDGLFKIGTVSGYMAGLWSIPIFFIIITGLAVEKRSSRSRAYLAVAVVSLLIFGISEQTVWMFPSWYPVNIKAMVSHTALYILIPEILLGMSSYFVFLHIRERSIASAMVGAFAVMIFYTGSAVFFYFLVEKVIY